MHNRPHLDYTDGGSTRARARPFARTRDEAGLLLHAWPARGIGAFETYNGLSHRP